MTALSLAGTSMYFFVLVISYFVTPTPVSYPLKNMFRFQGPVSASRLGSILRWSNTKSEISAVVQFIEFSSDVVSKTKELSNAGTTRDIQHLETLARDLLNLSQTLNNGMHSTGPNYGSLQDLCNECIDLGENMVKRLSRLKVYEGDAVLKIVKRAAAAVWSQKELDKLSRQLANFRSQIELHVLVSFRSVSPTTRQLTR